MFQIGLYEFYYLLTVDKFDLFNALKIQKHQASKWSQLEMLTIEQIDQFVHLDLYQFLLSSSLVELVQRLGNKVHLL